MITLNYRDSKPIYEQVKDGFRKLILSGVLATDERLPSVRELAAQLTINPNTIQKAFSLLEQEGYIYPVKGRGNFVADTAELSRKEQASLLEAAKTLMDRGRALGITKAQYLDLVNDVYRKGEEP